MAFARTRQVHMRQVTVEAMMTTELLQSETQASMERGAAEQARALRDADAVEIWIARWLRVPVKNLAARYGCHSRRLYEVWWGERFPASRARAEAEFRHRYPALANRTSYGYRRIPTRVAAAGQMALFD